MRLVLWNLRHRKGRHVMNMLVIAMTTAVLIVFTSALTQLIVQTRRVRNAVDARITIETKLGGDDILLPIAFARPLREIEGVKDVEMHSSTEGGTEEAPIDIVGEMESWANREDNSFRAADRARWKREAPDGALVSAEAAKLLHLQPGKLVELPTEFGPMQVKVSAIGPATGMPTVVVHFNYLQQRLKDPGNAYFRIYSAPADYAKVAQALEESLERAGHHVALTNETQFLLKLIEQASSIPVFFGFLGLFLIITSGLTLANNSAISIRERRVEMAALRVIGFPGRRLLLMIMAEVAIIGILGALVAFAALELLFSSGVNLAGDSWIFEAATIGPTHIGPTQIAIGLTASMLLPAIGALPSARWSLRKPLAVALRDAA